MFAIKQILLIVTTFLISIHFVFAEFKTFRNCITPGDFALTFEDGPSLVTSTILDILKKENVKATFFINGHNWFDLSSDTEIQGIIKREVEEGHIIGSHTYNHLRDVPLSDEQLIQELKPLNDIVFDLTGLKLAFLRPPVNNLTESNIKVIESLGFTARILWNLDSIDWNKEENAKANYFKHLIDANKTTDSFIALNHDTQKENASNLSVLITIIRNIGYRFVTVDECIGMSAYQNVNSLEAKVNSKIIANTNSTTTSKEKENKDGEDNTNYFIYILIGSLLLIVGSIFGAILVKNKKREKTEGPSEFIYGTGDNGDIIIYKRQTLGYNSSRNEEGNEVGEQPSINTNTFSFNKNEEGNGVREQPSINTNEFSFNKNEGGNGVREQHSINTNDFNYNRTNDFSYNITNDFSYNITNDFSYNITDDFSYNITNEDKNYTDKELLIPNAYLAEVDEDSVASLGKSNEYRNNSKFNNNNNNNNNNYNNNNNNNNNMNNENRYSILPPPYTEINSNYADLNHGEKD